MAGTRAHDAGPAEPPPPPSDSELWRRAARGDDAAFTDLFHRHAEAVWNHAYRLTGSWSEAEEVASTCFVTAWRKCAEVALVNDSARPWLYTVAANLARSRGRGERRRLRLVRRLSHPEAAADHADAVTDRVDGADRVRRVVAAVARLPKAQRRVAELCLLGELSSAEAATVLGLAEPTVRSHLSRARARLRTLVEES
ncbi:RNA polymerase sigma factor [Saccharomonospora saliphila]|uniref:RNA polymerase sigma factor n=1 Tax=Saccharomonospora saliphila TaxID=369829 RepID=UPI0003710A69|nr:RNA polymerase sigma factor [Saccharomonospora saliphila]